jgi:hypothetical protein
VPPPSRSLARQAVNWAIEKRVPMRIFTDTQQREIMILV